MQKAVPCAKPSSEMGLTSSVSSLDAQPNEVTTRCRGQGPGLCFPIWSHLLVLGGWGLQQTHGEQSCRLESDSRPHGTRVRVRFHTWSLEESPRSRGGGVFTFSARVWIFKGKNIYTFCRACYKARSAFRQHGIEEAPRAEAGEKSDSIQRGWECPPGPFKRFSFLIDSACYYLTRLPSTRLRAVWYPYAVLKTCPG